jgi:hypothetical protein
VNPSNLTATGTYKITENQNGVAFIQQVQSVMVAT